MIPQITINKQNGGIVRPLTSNDSISGLIGYANVPSIGDWQTLDSGSAYKAIFSNQEAIESGLVGDFSDEVKATATILVGGTFSNETLTLTVGAPYNYTANFGSMTGAPSVVAGLIAQKINNDFILSGGIRASASGATVSISAPQSTLEKHFGASGNAPVASTSGTGNSKVTYTNFSGGTTSIYAPLAYHISEFFRLGGTKLWVLLRATPTVNFTEVTELQTVAGGEIRQMAVFNTASFLATDVQVLQARANELASDKKYVQLLYAADIDGVSLSALPTLVTLNSENVSVVIGQDGAAVGSKLYNIYGYSITCLGAVLGVTSRFAVNESIAWTGKLQSIPFSTSELDVAAFANGVLFRTLSKSQIDDISSKNYIFLRKFDGVAGSFISDSLTATVPSSDFFSIERNRTIDKVRRLTGISLFPFLSSPILLDQQGKIEKLTRSVFEKVISSNLSNMVASQEISGFSVFIDPDQDVLTTDEIKISLQVLPIGVARFIEVNVSFTVTL